MPFQERIQDDILVARAIGNRGVIPTENYLVGQLLLSLSNELDQLYSALKGMRIRRSLECVCGNHDEEDVADFNLLYPPCSAECGRTMTLTKYEFLR